ncbi:MAG TPA: shikimate dehydrogenase [Candidatus Tectomicrobia bacterium]
MQQGRPPISTTTRLYGHFAHSLGQRPHPMAGVMNALLDQRGIDALWVPLQVSPDHFAAVVTGMRHLRDFAGFTVTMPHKAAAARLCDVLLPNAQACGVVNVVRIDPDGRLIGETFDGVAMVHAITAHRAIDATTRVLLVGAGGVGQAIGVALALAGVGLLAITNRTQAKADDLVQKVRCAAPACAVETNTAFDPAGFDIVINATSLGHGDGQGPLPVDVSRVSATALVADVVLVPEYTPLLQAAQARGLDIVRGIEMLTPQLEVGADFLGMTAHASAANGRKA